MRKQTDQRERTLLLAKILLEETDPRHPLTMPQLMERLEELGAPAERKSIYRDLYALQKHGLAVVYRRSKGWYLEEHPLTLEDLGLLIDALTVYPYLSTDRRAALAEKLQGFANVYQRPRLNRPVSLPPREEDAAQAVQGVLERIHAARQEGRALSFVLFEYNSRLERETVGARQVVSPKGLLWTGQAYRLLGWDHRGEELRLYRPERMEQVTVTGVPAAGPEADAALWAAQPFGADLSRRERVKLRCSPELAGEVVDRFGREAKVDPLEQGFLLTADVVLGPEFWAWMHVHRSQAELLSPPLTAQQWQAQCRSRRAG